MKEEIVLLNESATSALGESMAGLLQTRSGGVIGLEGTLGAGKTTLVRGLLRALCVTGTIRSPTYTLVEPYETAAGMILHLDLYRLTQECEFLALGLDDYAPDSCWWFVEWAEKARGYMPIMTLQMRFSIAGHGRVVQIEGPDSLVEKILRSFGETHMQAADCYLPPPAGVIDS